MRINYLEPNMDNTNHVLFQTLKQELTKIF